jgi:hypothetical protein|tara:strand:+ start:620 stop:805 length:186 start_codon:yes stop_codon:yes gene_type:complete
MQRKNRKPNPKKIPTINPRGYLIGWYKVTYTNAEAMELAEQYLKQRGSNNTVAAGLLPEEE